MSSPKRIIITPGEPAGIGPDVTIQIAQEVHPAELVVIADPTLLLERANILGLALQLSEVDLKAEARAHQAGHLKILALATKKPVTAGVLELENAAYVLACLEKAASLCEEKKASALVTGPIHKGIMNEAGISFSGHTEFLAQHAKVKQTVMLFVLDQLKVALATTHLPLREVPKALTQAHLQMILNVLNQGLRQQFQLKTPRILVAGLNPHAGEGGHLGREEIDIITPVLNQLRKQDLNLEGPLPADTLFTPKYLEKADAILAMYHDQALPLVKYLGFGHAVNMTLGLPYIRTSVDHGTALDMAGSGKADAGSLKAALALALKLLPL